MQLSNQIGSGPRAQAFGPDANTLWGPPVEAQDDGRGRGPRSLPCQQLPLGEQAAAGPSVQASGLSSLKSRAWSGSWKRRGRLEGRGSKRLDDKGLFTRL